MALQAEWTKITPAMAIEYLSHAAGNRSLRRNRVDAYARDMETGKWLLTGQPILFTAAGELVDGQHRLQAVITSGSIIEFLVVRGLQPRVIEVLDSGAARSLADVLTIQGETNHVAATLATSAKRRYLWDKGIRVQQVTFNSSPTHGELLGFIGSKPELRDYAQFATGKSNRPPAVPASSFAFIYGVLMEIDSQKGLEFCLSWRDGTGLTLESPVRVLRDRITSGELADKSHFGGSWGVEYKIALAFTAWRAFAEGRTLTKLQLPRGGLSDANYPTPTPTASKSSV